MPATMTDLLPTSSKRQKRSKAQVSDKNQNGYSVSIDEAHLSTLCGCGKCTVSTFLKNGCPKPTPALLGALPNLDIDGISDSNRLIRIGKLCLEHQQISGLFSTLESSVLKSLTSRHVPVETVSQLFQGVQAFPPPHAHTPLFSHQLSTLKEANTHSQLLKFASSLTSFFNYSLLETIINKLGSESDKDKLEHYKTKFNEFSKRNMLECPSYHEPPSQSEFCELVLKVDENFSKLTVGQLAQFMDWLGGFLMIARPSIQLVKVSKKENCHVEMVYPQLSKEVELVCCLATVVREEVLPVSPEQEEMLKTGGILEIHCGEFRQVLVALPQSAAALQMSEQHASEYFNNLTMAQAAMLLNPPHTVHDQSPKNGHTHDAMLRASVYGEGYLTSSPTVSFSQSDLATQFLSSRAEGPGTSSRDEQPSAEGVGSEVSESDEDAGKPKPKPAPGKKTRGRVKIPMKYIKNKLRRYTTFSKRKSNIMKKAYELSTLTGTQVMLMVASETGHVYTFATPKLQPMITSEAGKALIQTCLHQPDPPPTTATATATMVPPTTSPEQYDVRMSSAGYEEVDLGAYKLGEQKSGKATPTSLSSLLPSSFQADMSSLMPVLSSFRPPPLSLASPLRPPPLSLASPLRPPPLSLASPDYSRMKERDAKD